MSELPDNVKRFDILKIEYGKKKLCQCLDPHYEIDIQNRLVSCTDCNAIIDPFEVLCSLSRNYARIESQANGLLEQRKQIVNYKPWLLVFRNLESQYRSKEMLPCCPECKKPFFFEHINMWVNRKMEVLRREREKSTAQPTGKEE